MSRRYRKPYWPSSQSSRSSNGTDLHPTASRIEDIDLAIEGDKFLRFTCSITDQYVRDLAAAVHRNTRYFLFSAFFFLFSVALPDTNLTSFFFYHFFYYFFYFLILPVYFLRDFISFIISFIFSFFLYFLRVFTSFPSSFCWFCRSCTHWSLLCWRFWETFLSLLITNFAHLFQRLISSFCNWGFVLDTIVSLLPKIVSGLSKVFWIYGRRRRKAVI